MVSLTIPGLAVVLALSLAMVPAAAFAGSGFWSGGGPKAKSIYAIALDPVTPGVMYAGALGSGIFKTTDGGATWDPSTTGLTNTYVRAVAIAPQDLSILFAGTNDGLFRSTDAGISWTPSLLTQRSVRGIAFDTGDPNLMYAGTLGHGIYRSTDQGATWTPASAGLSDLNVRTIATHPVIPGTALAGSGSAGGVETTSTGGLYWTLVGDLDAQGAVSDIYYDPSSASRVYAAMMDRGCLRSDDGGVSWTRINTGLTTFRCRALSVVDTLRYLGTDSSGVFFTTLNSVSWAPADSGLPNLLIRALAARPDAPRTVYAGTDGSGLYRSTDAGTSWTPLNTYLTDTTGRSLLVGNDPGQALYCGTGFGDGIWRSGDDGVTWTRAESLDTRNSVLDLAQNPTGGVLYAAIYASGVYKSLDHGNQWVVTDTVGLTNRFVRCLSVSPADGQDIMAGTGDGPFHTLDGGASWSPANAGFPAGTSVREIVRSPNNPAVLYAGSDSAGVYKTTDGGVSWFASSNGLTQLYVRSLAIAPFSSSTILLGGNSGVFRTTDGGAHWQPFGTGLPDSASVRALLFDTGSANRVFAGIWQAGVYVSYDSGAHWSPMNTGLPDLKIYSLAWNLSRSTLFAGTRLRGVFACTIEPAGAEGPGGAPSAMLLQGRPNPTSGATDITFTLPSRGRIGLGLYSPQGTRVRLLRGGIYEAGLHRVAWDGRDDAGRRLPNGTYWLRLSAAGRQESVRLTLVR